LSPIGSRFLPRLDFLFRAQTAYEAGFANFSLHPATEVHFKNEQRAPLLIVGAEKDHTVPASVSRAQYRKYERSPARTDYLEFEGRPHLFMVGDGADEVAVAIDSWLDGVLDAAPAHRGGKASG
jgi:non-heme chloroperoxidase